MNFKLFLAIKKTLIVLVLIILSSFGFGYAILYKLSFGVILSIPLVELFERKKYVHAIIPLIVFFSVCLCNSLMFASSLIFVYLLIYYDNEFAYAFIASRILFSVSQYFAFNNVILSWISATFIFILFIFICRKTVIFGKLLSVIYAILLALNSLSSLDLPIVQESNVIPGYGLGFAIQKMINKPQNGKGKMLINLKNHVVLNDDFSYYLEHDAPTQFTDGNYYQKRPWGNNIILANETIQMAICRDNFLISNLGGRIITGKHKILMSFIDGLSSIPFAIINNGKIIMSDSDLIADGLAPYQVNLIKRITATDYSFICFHVFCSLLLITTIFSKNQYILLLSVFYYIVLISLPVEGDVRFVGKRRYWPHTTLGEGVVKAMQDQGFNAIFGTKNASVLVISEGHKAKRYNEKLIILEPNAKVKIDNKVYSAGSLELGYNNGILDARDIFLNGLSLGPVVNLDGVKIIATGSPARVNFKE